jgi:predicted small integral membrane protein
MNSSHLVLRHGRLHATSYAKLAVCYKTKTVRPAFLKEQTMATHTATGLTRMAILTKAVLALSIGLFGLLVAWTNVAAYSINFQFVQHVLSMDALASWAQVDALTNRAITSPVVHQLGYAAIIAGEFTVGILCAVAGVLLLLAAFGAKPQRLIVGKTLALAGCGVGLLVWYLGFAVIGAEYFAMWASDWNGQNSAYLFSLFLLMSMIYLAQPEPTMKVQDDE